MVPAARPLEGAGIRRLATFNGDDFRLFPFVEVVEPYDGEFKPGLDLGNLNQLADQLETKAFADKARGRR